MCALPQFFFFSVFFLLRERRTSLWTRALWPSKKQTKKTPYIDGLKNGHIYKRGDNKWFQVSINHYIVAVVWIAKTSVFWRMSCHEVGCSHVQGSTDPKSAAWSPVCTGLVLPGDLVLLRNHTPKSMFHVAHSHWISRTNEFTQIYFQGFA